MYKRTILIVDDQSINRTILGNLLINDYHILFAENGEEAMECLRTHMAEISAVILDIIMPVMDGYDVLRAMGEDPRLSLIPVIVSSQRDGDEAEIRALTLGAQDFIAKPYKGDIIRHRLSNIIRLRESSATINRIQKDPVTGLYNKEYFLSQVEDVLRENPDQEYDLFCFGIERFKLINDTYGAKMGDEVLYFLGDVLKSSCEKLTLVARFEADAFFKLREHKDQYTIEDFQTSLERIHNFDLDFDIKVHCGIYHIHNREIPVESMCDRAQMAANENKGNYDRPFSYYDESMRQKMLEQQMLIGAMQSALEGEQFEVYFQPKYDLVSQLIAGAEALVRWNHPQWGMISPGKFIPLFEENGFITQLDRYVWEKTCQHIRTWLDAGLPSISVSVNVSRADIYNPKLTDILLGLVAKYEIPIRMLHLEVTESAYTNNPQQIIEVVSRLRDHGFVVEMDDFGSGYSSLNMLAEMPIDVLKLDMRFIQTEAAKASGRGILSFIISLAKWMDLAVVAEGVETEEQVNVLRSMDCNYVQGYYYAKPMPAQEFQRLLETSNVTEMRYTSRTVVEYLQEGGEDLVAPNGRVMMIVDDIEINRAALVAAFGQRFVIKECENGQQAWDYLQNHWENVDIVMLDLLMPVMDGFRLLKLIRQDERMKKLPVIITSQGDPTNEQRALQMEADDFIAKPYNIDIIKHRVDNVLGNYKLKQIEAGFVDAASLAREASQEAAEHLCQEERVEKMMETLKGYCDIVRLVDPTKTTVYDTGASNSCDSHFCYHVWNRDCRCNNCTSMRAFEEHHRVSKLEYTKEGLFFVVSQYVPYGKFGAVIEMVTKLDNEYVDNVFDKEMLYLNMDELNEQVERDELTGVFNRRHLNMYLDQYLDTAKKRKEDIGIAMIDLDHFKELNDTRGHFVGDEILKKVSRIMEDNVAQSRGDFVARFGGDEFIIICRRIPAEVFRKRVQAVVQLIAHVRDDDGRPSNLSISAGCVMLSEMPKANGQEILKRADKRLYKAKEQGRGCVVSED